MTGLDIKNWPSHSKERVDEYKAGKIVLVHKKIHAKSQCCKTKSQDPGICKYIASK